MSYTIREYTTADETAWLRCRVLAFLHTAYFDDVLRSKPDGQAPGLELVAVDGTGSVVGIMDTSIDGALATIDTVAVHPDPPHELPHGIRHLEVHRRDRLGGTLHLVEYVYSGACGALYARLRR